MGYDDPVAEALSGITEANPNELADYVRALASTTPNVTASDIGETLTEDEMVTAVGPVLDDAVGKALNFILNPNGRGGGNNQSHKRDEESRRRRSRSRSRSEGRGNVNEGTREGSSGAGRKRPYHDYRGNNNNNSGSRDNYGMANNGQDNSNNNNQNRQYHNQQEQSRSRGGGNRSRRYSFDEVERMVGNPPTDMPRAVHERNVREFMKDAERNNGVLSEHSLRKAGYKKNLNSKRLSMPGSPARNIGFVEKDTSIGIPCFKGIPKASHTPVLAAPAAPPPSSSNNKNNMKNNSANNMNGQRNVKNQRIQGGTQQEYSYNQGNMNDHMLRQHQSSTVAAPAPPSTTSIPKAARTPLQPQNQRINNHTLPPQQQRMNGNNNNRDLNTYDPRGHVGGRGGGGRGGNFARENNNGRGRGANPNSFDKRGGRSHPDGRNNNNLPLAMTNNRPPPLPTHEKRTLYLTNIPPYITMVELSQYFIQKRVAVVNIKINPPNIKANNNNIPQKQYGTAHVQCGSHAQALSILRSPDPILGNRFIEIKFHFKNLEEGPEIDHPPLPPPHAKPPAENLNMKRTLYCNPEAEARALERHAKLAKKVSQKQELSKKIHLLEKQSKLFQKQLSMHKKILPLLQNKPLEEKQRKMKEILTTQKNLNKTNQLILELTSQQHHQSAAETTAKENGEQGVDCPITADKKDQEEEHDLKKRLASLQATASKLGVMEVDKNNVGGGGTMGANKKFSLDLRTRIVKVEGFPEAATEKDIFRHFFSFGSVDQVQLLPPPEEEEEDLPTLQTLKALVTFGDRMTAEKAKNQGAHYNNDTNLTFSWHNSSPPTKTSLTADLLHINENVNETGQNAKGNTVPANDTPITNTREDVATEGNVSSNNSTYVAANHNNHHHMEDHDDHEVDYEEDEDEDENARWR